MASHHHHDPAHRDGSVQSPLNSDTFTDINRKHWDQAASTYSSAQWQKDFINQIQAFIHSNINWIGVEFLDPSLTDVEKDDDGLMTARRVRVLDYACGPGTVTAVLQGYATEVVGVDVSENMVKAYNERFAVAEQQQQRDGNGVVVGNARVAEAFVGDLLESTGPSESISSPRFFGFDLAVVGLGFHHFENLDLATSRLVSRLKPGGVLLIVDFVTHAALKHGDPGKHIVAHQGFGEEEVRSVFGRAGLVDVAIVEMEGMVEIKGAGVKEDQLGQKRKVFLGRGKKPA